MRRDWVAVCLLVSAMVAVPQAFARGCKPDVVREDRITKERIRVWTQVLSETSFLGSLVKTSQTTVIATAGRYGSVNAINLEIQKREESAQNAAFESAWRGAAGKPILFGIKGGAPIELTITDVGNDARVAQGLFAAKGVTTIVLSAAVSNATLARLQPILTTKMIDAVRVVLSGDVRLEFAVDEDNGEDLMNKFGCFYRSFADDGVDLSRTVAPDAGSVAGGGGAPSPAVGQYVVRSRPGSFAELRADGTFRVTQRGQSIDGTYKIEGDTLTLTSPRIRRPLVGRLVGHTIVDDEGLVWEQETPKAAAPQLTPEQIIAMVNAKVSDDIVVTTIHASSLAFSVTPDVLIKLKTAGVSDTVLRALAP